MSRSSMSTVILLIDKRIYPEKGDVDESVALASLRPTLGDLFILFHVLSKGGLSRRGPLLICLL